MIHHAVSTIPVSDPAMPNRCDGCLPELASARETMDRSAALIIASRAALSSSRVALQAEPRGPLPWWNAHGRPM